MDQHKGSQDKDSSSTLHYRLAGDTIYLERSFILSSCHLFPILIASLLKKSPSITVDLKHLSGIDSAGVVTLIHTQKKVADQGKILHITGGSADITKKIKVFQPIGQTPSPPSCNEGLPASVGQATAHFFTHYVFAYLTLTADIAYWAINDLFKVRNRRKGEIINQASLIGVSAVLIVCFMSLVIGLVLAVQSAGQLQSFGANLYIVDLVVIGMLNQMAPLITAILVAGRSGSAIAAEIATMKVTSEIDALTTMGLNPIRFVVIPKMYAGLLTMPFLIVFASAFGVLGGAIIAFYQLDITPEIFIHRMEVVMKGKYLLTSLIKSQAYAALIVITGSFYGFRVVRGAEGVGKATTQAVVVTISLIILADSLIGLIFY